jgi:hypothetical protein
VSIDTEIDSAWLMCCELPTGVETPLYLVQGYVIRGDRSVPSWKVVSEFRAGARRIGGPEAVWKRSTTRLALHAAVHEALERMRPQ